jgi:glycosyltransferase involved in cell wall biosynthesis
MDWDLVQTLARAEPTWNLVFLGKIHQPPPRAILSLANVHFMGQVPYEDVPDYYRRFNVGWVPHRVTELTSRQSSLKVLEYLAAGLPTVVTQITFADDLDPVVRVARDQTDVVAAIREELAGDEPEWKEIRAAAARHHSWDVRLADIGVALLGATA